MLRTLAPTALCLSVILTLYTPAIQGQAPAAQGQVTAQQVLDRAIEHHDPEGLWFDSVWRLTLRETRPNGPDRHSTVTIDYPRDHFQLDRRVTVDGTQYHVEQERDPDGGCRSQVDGKSQVSPELHEKLRLDCERLDLLRNYYTYLWGLPMKLRDPGTRLDPVAREETFQDQPVHALRVTYDEEVGSDIWYFYFRRQDAALVGYRFYHDESANDGEVIYLEGELDAAGLRLPRERSWYTHADDRFLGTDIVSTIERLERSDLDQQPSEGSPDA